MRSRALQAVCLLALAAPGIGQNDAEPYFALSSGRTFAPNGKPTVGLSAYNVKALEFRVYRVNDPVKFFQQLEDSHRFGGSNPPPSRERTWIERIHDWKRGLRANIRTSLRAQFTESPRRHFESILPRQSPPKPGKGAEFAQAPVLNSQQLVLRFTEPVKSGESRWETHTVNVPVKEQGVYLVEAVHQDLRAYTILMLSDLVMISKTGRNRISTFVARRDNGEPVAGAEVFVFTRDGQPASARTNSHGFAEFPVPAQRPEELRVVARHSGDTAVNALAGYAFNASREHWSGYVYTDRPVYRPGHTTHYKAILRIGAGGGYTVPAGRQVNVAIHDPDQKAVYQKTLTASANGTIHDNFNLPAGAALGNYSIEIKPSGSDDYIGGDFEVQEYKKPEYEVRVNPAKPRVLQGDTVQAVIDARYYFGEPVANAKVKYSVYRSRYWFPLWYEPDDDQVSGEGEPGADEDEGDQLSDVEGTLDAEGKLTIRFETKPSEHKWDFRYRIEARVTDAANREISGSGWVTATYGSFLVNVQPERYFYQPEDRGTFRIDARDYDSKPVQTRVHVELVRWNWRDPNRREVKGSTDVTTSGEGAATAELAIPAEGGSYRVIARARTPEGRDVEQSSYLWIAGRGGMDWGGDRRSVEIVPDKKRYRPGDTARLLILTGRANTPVLVSVEGRDLRSQQVIRSQDSSAAFDVPVSIDDEPGFFVSAQFIRDGELYQGVKRIKVPPDDHKLTVKISTDKPQYQPGAPAIYTLDVTDLAGKPVPRAEFSLGVVDEAIYAVRRDSTPDILTHFYGASWNTVYTTSSLEYYFSGEAGKRRMRLASLRPPSTLAQLKPEREVRPKVRKIFPDTAFWAPAMITDGNGRATARVDFPDTLTTWRATARGVTAGTKAGAATLKTIVRKNLILRLAVPRFFVQGDEVVIGALVHNYLASEKTARVSLKLEGLEVLTGTTREVRIASRGETKVEWRVRARQVRNAKIYGEAVTGEESDALELELPVNPPGVKLSLSKGGSIGGTSDQAFALTFPQQVEPGSRSLTIRISPSIAGSLFGALDFLTAFPYGCVEQTMSSFLPNIIVQQAIGELGLRSNVDQAALNEKIRAGLDRLYSFQHEDGGWGWWQTDDSHPFMTAYVVAGLVQARNAGTQVNGEAIERGAAWLESHNDPKYLPDMRAYLHYALSLAGRKAANPPPLERLSPYGLAILGQVSGRKPEIEALLERQVKQNDAEAWWPATRDEMLDFSADITPEATAHAVKFLASQNPNHPLLPKAAVWLMNHRSEGYWWSSTKQTAMVIYGLIDYLKASKELNPNLFATVYVNDQPVLAKPFSSATSIEAPEIRLDESQLRPGENRIRVAGKGQGRLYYSARAEYYSTEERLQTAGQVQLNILRDYFRLEPQRQGEKMVYDLAPLEGGVAPGDTLAVRLTVTGGDWKYLLIEDPIPAGTEFIERDHLYEIKARPPWWRWGFTRRELHDDRMAIFQTHFAQGQDQYFYLLKVVNPGAFRVGPARVQPMYQPEFLSTTGSRRLEVAP